MAINKGAGCKMEMILELSRP